MLRALKRDRLGQIAVAIASLLAVSGSLGLHPEPAPVGTSAAPSGFVAWHGAQRSDASAHDCLACLAHRSVPLARLSGVVLAPGATVALLIASLPQQPLPAETRTHEGRAPPALT